MNIISNVLSGKSLSSLRPIFDNTHFFTCQDNCVNNSALEEGATTWVKQYPDFSERFSYGTCSLF